MNVDSYRELKVLEEISSNPSPTQRHLSQKMGVALGLANLMIRRCVTKGYLKIVNLQKNRIQYLITPKGIAEKSRLTYEYLEYSLHLYRGVREVLRGNLKKVVDSGGQNVVFIRTGEIAEIAYLTVKEVGLNLVGVVDDRPTQGDFLGLPIFGVEALSKLKFDYAVVGSLNDDVGVLKERLNRLGVVSNKILVIRQEGPHIYGMVPGLGGVGVKKGQDKWT